MSFSEQLVERLLYAAADQLLDLPLDYFLVELYNVVGHGLLSPFRMCVVTSFYQRPASRVYFFMLFSICAFYYTLSLLFITKEIFDEDLVKTISKE